MIAGYHIIFGAYGFWLPNDPRGSWSKFVGSWDLFKYGPATQTTERRSLAHREHDGALRISAKSALKYPAVKFTGVQARAVGRGFAGYVGQSGLKIFACAILPDHVHLVTGPVEMEIDQLVIQLKGEATQAMEREGIHPMARWREARSGRAPNCWVRGQWKVYLDPGDMERAIRYVEANPLKEGKKRQVWSFVIPWEGGERSASRRG